MKYELKLEYELEDYEEFYLKIKLKCPECGKVNKLEYYNNVFIDGGYINAPCEKCGSVLIY